MYNPTFKTDENGVVLGWGFYRRDDYMFDNRDSVLQDNLSHYNGNSVVIPANTSLVIDEGYGFHCSDAYKLSFSFDSPYPIDVKSFFIKLIGFHGYRNSTLATWTATDLVKTGDRYSTTDSFRTVVDGMVASDARLVVMNGADTSITISNISIQDIDQ